MVCREILRHGFFAKTVSVDLVFDLSQHETPRIFFLDKAKILNKNLTPPSPPLGGGGYPFGIPHCTIPTRVLSRLFCKNFFEDFSCFSACQMERFAQCKKSGFPDLNGGQPPNVKPKKFKPKTPVRFVRCFGAKVKTFFQKFTKKYLEKFLPNVRPSNKLIPCKTTLR